MNVQGVAKQLRAPMPEVDTPMPEYNFGDLRLLTFRVNDRHEGLDEGTSGPDYFTVVGLDGQGSETYHSNHSRLEDAIWEGILVMNRGAGQHRELPKAHAAKLCARFLKYEEPDDEADDGFMFAKFVK